MQLPWVNGRFILTIYQIIAYNMSYFKALLDLAAMKTYALGGRAKWKDYVDLYFILKAQYDLRELSARATKIFGT